MSSSPSFETRPAGAPQDEGGASKPAKIVVDRVDHLYRPPRGRPVLALENNSLEIREREFIALLGPS